MLGAYAALATLLITWTGAIFSTFIEHSPPPMRQPQRGFARKEERMLKVRLSIHQFMDSHVPQHEGTSMLQRR
jgi:hypothetical protein